MAFCGTCNDDIEELQGPTMTMVDLKCSYCAEKDLISFLWQVQGCLRATYVCLKCGTLPRDHQMRCHLCQYLFQWREMGDFGCEICGVQFCRDCERSGAVFMKCVSCSKYSNYCTDCTRSVTLKDKIYIICNNCNDKCIDKKGVFSLDNLRCKRYVTHRRRCSVKVGLKRQFCQKHRYYKKRQM